MIVFAAATPHSPLLIPGVAKDTFELLDETTKALEHLARELYAAQPDVIVIITPHGESLADAFTINLAPEYTVDFEEFGDFSTKLQFKGSPQLAHGLKERIMYEMPMQFVHVPKLDYGCGIPLAYLTKKLPGIEIIPISHSLLPLQTHFGLGQLLKRELTKTSKRVAIIASGNLAHSHEKGGPAPFSAAAGTFDELVKESLQSRNPEPLIFIDPVIEKKAAEDALRSLLILMGTLDGKNYRTDIFAYQQVMGVGYLTAQFILV